MGQIVELLLNRVNNQLQQGLADPQWLEQLTSHLTSLTSKNINPTLKDILGNVLDNLLTTSKPDLIKFGTDGFALFLHQIATGDNNAAIETYIRTHATPQEIIDEMIAGAAGVIAAKKRIDNLTAQALTLLEKVGIAAAQALLPFILAMI